MGLVTGIKGIIAESTPRETSSVKWLTMKDGQAIKVRFLNELDEESKMYDPERGVAAVVHEDVTPGDFKTKAQCTMDDEGRCWACEQAARGEKEWRPKTRFYANVIVDNGIDDPYVAVWNMGVFRSTTFATIKEHYMDNGSISDWTFKLKRQGEKTDTTYLFLPQKQDSEPFDFSPFKPYDLNDAIRAIPYVEQQAYYMRNSSGRTTTESTIGETESDGSNLEW